MSTQSQKSRGPKLLPSTSAVTKSEFNFYTCWCFVSSSDRYLSPPRHSVPQARRAPAALRFSLQNHTNRDRGSLLKSGLVGMAEQFNPAPVVHERKARPARAARENQDDESVVWDSQEVFELVRDIQDPEHPYSLEQLNVISEDAISVDDKTGRLSIMFTPTVQHCGMAPLIGLSLRVKLLRSLPSRYKVDISLAPGSHSTEAAVNKQLNDKERVAAALENPHLAETIERCLSASYE